MARTLVASSNASASPRRPGQHRFRASGCSERCSSEAAMSSSSFSVVPSATCMLGDARFAFGQGAGLVEHHGIDVGQPLQGFAALEEDAELRASSDGDGQRRRHRESHRAWAGNDQHGDGGGEGKAEVAVIEAQARPGRSPARCQARWGRRRRWPGPPIAASARARPALPASGEASGRGRCRRRPRLRDTRARHRS